MLGYSLFDKPSIEVDLNTKYGKPSDKISIGEIEGKTVAFLPRHGKGHTIPPHMINYKANIQALSDLGVERIIATTAVGSLKDIYEPGKFVFPDQFINFTHREGETFFDGPEVAHISTAYPYCNELRSIAISAADSLGTDYLDTGTIATINGPRFSTKAESDMFKQLGSDIINMTQYPEIALAKEKAMCYFSIALVTDYDAGIIDENIKPVTSDEVNRMFASNLEKLKSLIIEIIKNTPEKRSCDCKNILDNAFMNKNNKK